MFLEEDHAFLVLLLLVVVGFCCCCCCCCGGGFCWLLFLLLLLLLLSLYFLGVLHLQERVICCCTNYSLDHSKLRDVSYLMTFNLGNHCFVINAVDRSALRIEYEPPQKQRRVQKHSIIGELPHPPRMPVINEALVREIPNLKMCHNPGGDCYSTGINLQDEDEKKKRVERLGMNWETFNQPILRCFLSSTFCLYKAFQGKTFSPNLGNLSYHSQT